MRKRFILLTLIAIITFSISSYNIKSVYGETEYLYLGGISAGFRIDARGAIVIGVNEVISADGLYSPSKDAGISAGDIILSLDGKRVNGAEDIGTILSGYDGNGLTATVEKNGEINIKIIYPVKDLSGKYRLGAFIRDDVSGIGTITYIRENGDFGALGHPVTDGEDSKPVKVNSGEAYICNVIGVTRGERGRAGEIRGYFIEDRPIGIISANTPCGLFGMISDKKLTETLKKLPIGEARPGSAVMYTTVDGTTPSEFSVSVVKVEANAPENKNLVIKITDERLIDKTGGILQGMSGSPIVQGGKIVGAVTHVFINDPTRGFGILIDKMLTE